MHSAFLTVVIQCVCLFVCLFVCNWGAHSSTFNVKKLMEIDGHVCLTISVHVMRSLHVVRYYCVSCCNHCVHFAGEADNEQCLLHAEEWIWGWWHVHWVRYHEGCSQDNQGTNKLTQESPCFQKISILVPRAHDPSGLRQELRALGATILNNKGNNRILPIRFHCAVCIYGACLKWLLPELSIPVAGQKDRRLWEREWKISRESEFIRILSRANDQSALELSVF